MPPKLKPGAFCHIEIPTTDMRRAKKFYGNLFGWKFQDMPGAPGGYTLYEAPCGPGGGLSGCADGKLPPVLNYILVEKLGAHAKKLVKAGGTIVEAKQAVPGFGWFVTFDDPDGNRLALWEPAMPAPAKGKAKPKATVAKSKAAMPNRRAPRKK